MARAKRTDRAEARRRNRARYLAETAPGDVATDAADAPDAPATIAPPDRNRAARDSRRPATTGATLGGPPRPSPAGGFRNAFRLAFHPANVREDLPLIPRLLLHKSFLLPVLISAAVAGVIIAFQGREIISSLVAQYFLGPAPFGAVFIAGFLAPRASYLIGGLVGLVTAVLTAVVALSLATAPISPLTLAAELSLVPITGAFLASAAAWYRRFLYLGSPTRQLDRRPAPPRGKPARGR